MIRATGPRGRLAALRSFAGRAKDSHVISANRRQDRLIVHSVASSAEDLQDLLLKRIANDRVHSASRSLETAVPRRQGLTVAQRRPQLVVPKIEKTFGSSVPGMIDEPGGTPISGPGGVPNQIDIESLEFYPTTATSDR